MHFPRMSSSYCAAVCMWINVRGLAADVKHTLTRKPRSIVMNDGDNLRVFNGGPKLNGHTYILMNSYIFQ